MKILSVLLFLLSFNLQAEELYSSVDDYLKTLHPVNEEQQFNKELIKEKDPSRDVSKNKKWYVGYGPGGTNYSAYLYLLEAKQGKLNLVTKVNTKEDWQYPYMFEEIAFDTNDKFHTSIQLISNGNATHTYYFQLIKNKWYLVIDDYRLLGNCGEGDDAGTYSDSLQLATNYLTGEIKEQRYSEKDCKPLKLIKKKRKFSLVSLSDFYPFMEIEPQQ